MADIIFYNKTGKPIAWLSDKDDETIYKGYHTFDTFGYGMGHILSFDEDGKIIRTED